MPKGIFFPWGKAMPFMAWKGDITNIEAAPKKDKKK